MKNKYLLMLGILMCSIFGTNLTLKANTQTTNIPVQFSDIKIIVDGMTMKTSNQPFIYNGVTYLPVRDVASASGKIVNWDYNNKAVILTSANHNQSSVQQPIQQQNNKPVEQPTTQKPKPTNNIRLSDGNYIAGKDFPAGKYNVRCIEGSGNVISSNYEGGINSIMASPEKLEEYKKIGMSIGVTEFKNCSLPDGTELSVSGVFEQLTIELIPS